jgi:hypothetical protein
MITSRTFIKELLLSLLIFGTMCSASAQWSTLGNNTVHSNTGNVGIGTASPCAPLHIKSTSNTYTGQRNAIVLDNGNLSGNRSSDIVWAANGVPKWEMGNDKAANGEQTFYLFDLESTAFPRLLITSNGNICIGTDNPKGYKLAVAGGVIAESVTIKMQNTWPDYVFDKDYKLLPLPELKKFVDRHRHLPEVSSEKDIKDKGLDLAEINRQLTKKIEELTLYLIENDESDKLLLERLKKLEKASARNSSKKILIN